MKRKKTKDKEVKEKQKESKIIHKNTEKSNKKK